MPGKWRPGIVSSWAPVGSFQHLPTREAVHIAGALPNDPINIGEFGRGGVDGRGVSLNPGFSQKPPYLA